MSSIVRTILPLIGFAGLALSASAADHSPIPLRFYLDKPAIVTLVIEVSAGKRLLRINPVFFVC